MLDLSQALQIALVTVATYMTLVYVVSLWMKDTSIVDIAWGPGFVAVALALKYSLDSYETGLSILTLMVALWGLRLGWHIFKRKGPEEDWRYAQWREEAGSSWWWRSFFKVFVTQGLMMVIIATPLLVAATNAQVFDVDVVAWLGIAIWAVGFYFEAVGDYQLNKFIEKKKRRKKPKKGKQIMTSGLWKYTRHPNYFGEVTQWWGIYVMMLSLSGTWWAIISPITITFLLLKVSGVTMLEKKYEGNKEFEKYKQRTSAFFPMPPKRS